MKKHSLLFLIAAILQIILGVFIITYVVTEQKFLLYICASCVLIMGILIIVASIVKKGEANK